MSEYIKTRIGALDGRTMNLMGSGGGGGRNAVTDLDVAAALAASGFENRLIPKVLEWCYMESGSRQGVDLFQCMKELSEEFLSERRPKHEWPKGLLDKVIYTVLEEMRWQWSVRLTKERIAVKEYERVQKLIKSGHLPDHRVPRPARDRAKALGLGGGKTYQLWLSVQPLYSFLYSTLTELEYRGLRSMGKSLR